jgi:hypothetical protein
MMQLTLDQLLDYPGNAFAPLSRCQLRVWTAPGQRPVACMTELADNPGMSVTNAIEKVAAAAKQLIDGPEPIWIEQGQDWGDDSERSLAIVEFTLLDPGDRAVVGGVHTPDGSVMQLAGRYSNPRWLHVTPAEVAERFGIEV